MTEVVAKRADELVIGDRILRAHLPAYARSSDADVFHVKRYPFHGLDWVFVAFMLDDGDHLSTSYGHDQIIQAIPAPPLGHGYSRADDGESPQPSAGRVPAHHEDARTGEVVMVGGHAAVEVAGGFIEVDPPEGFIPASASRDMTGAAVTQNCVFAGDIGSWCETHQAVHIASGEGECGCPVYPYVGRGDVADTIIDHRLHCGFELDAG